jgi:hypothetical protein
MFSPSNASDALDKLRFLSVTDSSMLADGSEMEIRIKPDPETETITITCVPLLNQLGCLSINHSLLVLIDLDFTVIVVSG